MKLHGHARLELTDMHTGEVEVVESDNLITNAVSDIFNGYGGSLYMTDPATYQIYRFLSLIHI